MSTFILYIRHISSLSPLTAGDPGSVVTQASHRVEHAGRLAAQEAGGAVTEAREEQGAVRGVSQPVVIPEPLIEASTRTRELILVKRCAAWPVMRYLDLFKWADSGPT